MDLVLRKFLENSHANVMALAASSDTLEIEAHPLWPPTAYRCLFHVPYLRSVAGGVVERGPGPVAAVLHIPPDYLHPMDKYLYLRVASVLNLDIVHPNISPIGGVCLGAQLTPGTPIHGLLHQLYEILTYRNCGLSERNAFNGQACRLLRQHPELRRQLNPPPLVRRKHQLQIHVEAL
jgi:hypothetical protein